MSKFVLIKPANHLLGKNFNFQSDMQADIRASINCQAESKWQTSQPYLMLILEISTLLDQNRMKVT